MKIFCAWCKTLLREIDDPSHSPDAVSSGVCPACFDFFTKNRKERPMTEFLDSLAVPVVALDKDRRVQFANTAACRLLGKTAADMQGTLTGDALECAYARLPEGCGKTEHCEACTIRLAAVKTFETGEDCQMKTSLMMFATPQGDVEGYLKIFTTKRNGLVFLRIDELQTALTLP